MEPTPKFEEIVTAIDLDSVFFEMKKKSRLGAPTELNYGAMMMSKKRGRKKKEEREQWLIVQAEREANLSPYEKKIIVSYLCEKQA